MKSNGASERHQNNNLKAVIAFANFLGTDMTFFDVQLKEQILVRAIRKQRTEASSSSGMSVEVMTTMNNRRKKEEDDWFTPKKVLAYCMIIGLISGTLSIFIDSLIVLSVGAFVFASITVWYMFYDKFQRWEERRRRTKEKYFL
jgi:hypothetical protein